MLILSNTLLNCGLKRDLVYCREMNLKKRSFSIAGLIYFFVPVIAVAYIFYSYIDINSSRLIYLKTGDNVLSSNFNGLEKSGIFQIPKSYKLVEAPISGLADVSDFKEIFYLVKEHENEVLKIYENGKEQKIFIGERDDRVVDSVVSSDGGKIALVLQKFKHDANINGIWGVEIWTLDVDGTNTRLVSSIDYTSDINIVDFLSWSSEENRIYVYLGTDSNPYLSGLYFIDLETGKFLKAETPDVFLRDLDFSPDKKMIAYVSLERDVLLGKWKEPFAINVVDLETGNVDRVLESKIDQYSEPLWSPDGDKILYKVTREHSNDCSIYFFNTKTRKSSLITSFSELKNTTIDLSGWLSDNEVIYVERSIERSGSKKDIVTENLFVIRTNGTKKYKIDSANEIKFLGSFRLSDEDR